MDLSEDARAALASVVSDILSADRCRECGKEQDHFDFATVYGLGSMVALALAIDPNFAARIGVTANSVCIAVALALLICSAYRFHRATSRGRRARNGASLTLLNEASGHRCVPSTSSIAELTDRRLGIGFAHLSFASVVFAATVDYPGVVGDSINRMLWLVATLEAMLAGFYYSARLRRLKPTDVQIDLRSGEDFGVDAPFSGKVLQFVKHRRKPRAE